MAIGTYKIENTNNKNSIEISEVTLLKMIKISKVRDKALYNKLTKTWEELEGRKFDEKYLEE